MNGTFSDYQVHEWLKNIRANCWVSLHYDSPLTGGAYASEFSGSGYVRVKLETTTPSNRTMWNTNLLRFTGLNAGTIAWVGGWNAQYNGDLLWADMLPVPKRIVTGGTYTIIEGDLALSFA